MRLICLKEINPKPLELLTLTPKEAKEQTLKEEKKYRQYIYEECSASKTIWDQTIPFSQDRRASSIIANCNLKFREYLQLNKYLLAIYTYYKERRAKESTTTLKEAEIKLWVQYFSSTTINY